MRVLFEEIRYILCVTPGCPTIVRADRGTENTNVAFIQPCFRHYHVDSFAKDKSFMYGQSTANQVCNIFHIQN